MSEGQEITAEVELPDVGQRFDRRKYYNWQLARQNFSGEDGAKLAVTHLEHFPRLCQGYANAWTTKWQSSAGPLIRTHAEKLLRRPDNYARK
jgi:hypothetical protein